MALLLGPVNFPWLNILMNRASIYFRVVVEFTSIFQSLAETLEGFSVQG